MELTSTATIGVAALMLFFLGLGLGRLLSYLSSEAKLSRAREEMRSHETEFKQLARTAEKLRVEKVAFNNFMVQMSEFAREINTEITAPKLAKLLLRIVDQMFQARQILIFYNVNTDGESRLVLEVSKGYSRHKSNPLSIRMGEGRVGWVAEHQNTMDREDFSNQSRVTSYHDNDPAGLRLDVLSPMVHDHETRGVICVGGAELQHPDQKRMLKMVADLGSAALHSASQFREVQDTAHTDGLTRLMNKKYFMEQLSYLINDAEKARSRLAVFLFDIDHFKFYNDNNGHLAGDEVLKSIGEILRESTQEDFRCGRYGGEEFVVAMPGHDLPEAKAAAERIRAAVEAFPFHNQEKQPGGNLTLSGGVSIFPTDAGTLTDLIKHADKALYQAKSNGRNRVEIIEPAFLGTDQVVFFGKP